MSAVARAYTFTDGTDAYGSQVENEFTTIYNAWNNHDAGTSKWTVLSSLNSSSVPLVADNSSGTNDIVNFKDNSSTVFKVADGGNVTIGTGNLIFGTSGKGITGTIAADDAATGNLGQVLTSTAGFTNAPTTNQLGDLTSLSITAGDWDIYVSLYFTGNGATWSKGSVGVSSTAGNDGTGLVSGDNRLDLVFANSSTAITDLPLYITAYRVNVSSTTTYYLKYLAVYTLGTPQAKGRITARRVR